jgi:hypothetical protein
MDTECRKDEEDVYHAAAAKPKAERAAFLRDICKGNPALLVRVETLLQPRDEAGNFLEAPALDISATLGKTHLAEDPGTVIDRANCWKNDNRCRFRSSLAHAQDHQSERYNLGRTVAPHANTVKELYRAWRVGQQHMV